MNPRISVVIPSFQAERTIGRAIESVLKQTYQNFEILIVDNASSDNTEEIVQEFCDQYPNIHYFYSEVNLGPAGGRNIGIENSKGEFIAFLDADDEFCSGKIEQQIAILQKHAEVDLVFTDALNIDEEQHTKVKISSINNRFLKELELLPLEGFGNGFLLSGPLSEVVYKKCFILISTVMVRKSALKRVGSFDPTRFGTEDIDLFVRLGFQSKFVFLNEIQVNRYQYLSSVSSTNERWLKERENYHLACLQKPEYITLRKVAKINLRQTYIEYLIFLGNQREIRRAISVYFRSLHYRFDIKIGAALLLTLMGPKIINKVLPKKQIQSPQYLTNII